MDNIQELIRKLLAKANGTESEQEALAFATKAAELAQRHNLDLAALSQTEAKDEPIVKVRMVDVNTNGWRLVLYSAVADLYFSSYYTASTVEQNASGKWVDRKVIYFYGKQHNVDITMSMCDYLVKTILRLAKQHYKDRYSVLHFEKACGFRLASRVREMVAAAKTKVVLSDGTQSGLPALYATEEKLVEDYTKTLGLSPGRAITTRTGSSASAAGRAAADKVNLGGQLGTRSNSRMLT